MEINFAYFTWHSFKQNNHFTDLFVILQTFLRFYRPFLMSFFSGESVYRLFCVIMDHFGALLFSSQTIFKHVFLLLSLFSTNLQITSKFMKIYAFSTLNSLISKSISLKKISFLCKYCKQDSDRVYSSDLVQQLR